MGKPNFKNWGKDGDMEKLDGGRDIDFGPTER